MKIKTRKRSTEDPETLISGPEGNWPFPSDRHPAADPFHDSLEDLEEVLRRTTEDVVDYNWIVEDDD